MLNRFYHNFTDVSILIIIIKTFRLIHEKGQIKILNRMSLILCKHAPDK